MSFYSGAPFFGTLILLLLFALLFGCMEKSLRWYNLIVSGVMVVCVLGGNLTALAYFAGYFLIEWMLVRGYEYIRKKYGRKAVFYRSFVLLSILPLALCKLCDLPWLKEINLFQFTGISYLTFRVVQIIIELYDGTIEEVKFFDFTAFLIFFPTFSCGPIDRSRRFLEDYHNVPERREYLERFGIGLQKLVLGAAYKFVFADFFYQIMNQFMNRTAGDMVCYAYSYGFYMFFDFAGYSLMAVGTGYMLGICVPDNFKKPFISRDMKEFWARWHISLSEWFRDFVFSRFMMLSMHKKWFKSRLNGAAAGFLINMLVMGVWHGLTVHYILYGLYHGILLAVTEIYQKKSKFYKKYKKKTWYALASWGITLNLVMFGFLIFSGHFITI